jgi:xylulokinase
MSLLIGVDLGTSETKAGLFDLEGKLLRLARCGYPIITRDEPGCAEQEPDTWWRAVCQTLREITAGVPAGEVLAVCVEGQGPSVVMLDEQGRPLYNAILWLDTRSVGDREELSRRLGRPVSPFAFLPLAMWLQRNQGEAYQLARWFLSSWDFIAFRLCGRPACSALAYFHPFPPEEREAAGLPDTLFPATVQSGHPIAGLTASAAQETGLPVGLPVIAGAHDGIATFIGAGLVEMGRAADVNGTSGGLALCWNSPIAKPGIFSAVWIHPGEYIVGGAMATLGKCLDWVHGTLADTRISREALIAEAVQTPAGSSGLLFLPYLAGERAPIWDPLARGVFFGLSLTHRREHLVRAVLESVAFSLRQLAEELTGAGARMDEIRVCGGQSLSKAWNQIKADVIGVPVAVPRVREAALMGAAVLAGMGAERLPDITSAAHQMVRIDEVLAPDADRHQLYTELYGVYQRLYPDLREAFHQLGSIAHDKREGLVS